ncbi:Major facilitator superfamily MFS-1 domain containing protein, protein [Aphelenchoides bicaudatus]|nr:Major facilitator superfamily MFS-1 domain containing protein, protein [Aphelenchoides bicaudatus]
MSKQIESLASTVSAADNKNVVPQMAISYQTLDAEKMVIYAMASIGALLYACEMMIMPLIVKEDVQFVCISEDPDVRVIDKCTVENIAKNVTFTCGQVAKTYLKFDEAAKNTLLTERYSDFPSQIATPIVATLSDKYGRRLTFLLPSVDYGPCKYLLLNRSQLLLVLAVPSYCWRRKCGFVIQIECATASFRSMSPLFMSVVWFVGYMGIGVLHMLIPNWRWHFFSFSAPCLVTFAFYWLMPESIHWMISNNRSDGVKKYIKQSCRINRREIQLNECQSATRIEDLANEKKVEEKRGFMEIFRRWPLIFHLILHCYIMITMNGTYWALSLFSVDLHENEMVGYFLSGLVELPAGLISIILLLYFGRRFVTFSSLMLQALCMLFAVLYPGKSVLSMSFPLMAKVFNSITWTSEPLLFGEMSPTIVRNAFFGCIGFVGETGSILAPYTNVLKEIHELAPPFVICTMSVVAALASLFSPETRNKPLPETIEDFDAGPVYRKLFGPRKSDQKPNNRTTTEPLSNPDSPKSKETEILLNEA